jgi:ubiquinone/menaquinone biosynthesis C-methylase UbiE
MDYIHGYSAREQERLIQQAEYWREKLILRDLNYQAGEKLLEIGCGAGAVLGILGTAFPGLKLAGIDLETKQIEYANQHLKNLKLQDVDLRVGDASQLPWENSYFDRIYAMWFLEHLPDPLQVLREAKRVLEVGGTITLTETDYRTIVISPHCSDYSYLQDSLCELLLAAKGHPYVGQSLATLLTKSGFEKVNNQPVAVHYAHSLNRQELADFVAYVDSWLAPTVADAILRLGKDRGRLEKGLNWFRNIPSLSDGAISATVYRASGEVMSNE